jgi:hypothetical protein
LGLSWASRYRWRLADCVVVGLVGPPDELLRVGLLRSWMLTEDAGLQADRGACGLRGKGDWMCCDRF